MAQFEILTRNGTEQKEGMESVASGEMLGKKGIRSTLDACFVKFDAGEWKDIVSITGSENHMAGLRKDGTVAAVGCNKHGQCDIGDWKDIMAIACGSGHTAGLRKDGTVVAAGLM